MSLPDAEFVIIGGGAIGCGAAYALAKAGKTNILLVERAEDVGQVTTSQGAGLCGQARDSLERTRLAMHSVAVFRELQKNSAVKPDWNEVGSIRLALSDKAAEEFRRLKETADGAGLETALIDNGEAQRLWPLMDFSQVKAVLWCPSDGWMTPISVAKAYAEASRRLGVRISTGTVVQNILQKDGRAEGVQTSRGTVKCRYVINAAGAHAYHVAKLVGLDLPIVPVRHEYYITVSMPELRPDLPCFRIPELTLYGRVRDGGLLLGGWEHNALHTDPRDYPLKGTPPEVAPDWPVLNGFEASFTRVLPAAGSKEKKFVGKGWPTFTPDGRFIIGESSQVKGFIMAGGCNAHGISGSGGIGKLLVESLFDPKPSAYVRSLSPDRFTATKWDWEDACTQSRRIYETYYGPGC
ncbi:MAG: FAD-binding oxidoreductase [Verrucomicrobia subdivision 3 bacterium]|nr:FAD-binding oxidoreductase [Limisphaerales bacterium]